MWGDYGRLDISLSVLLNLGGELLRQTDSRTREHALCLCAEGRIRVPGRLRQFPGGRRDHKDLLRPGERDEGLRRTPRTTRFGESMASIRNWSQDGTLKGYEM